MEVNLDGLKRIWLLENKSRTSKKGAKILKNAGKSLRNKTTSRWNLTWHLTSFLDKKVLTRLLAVIDSNPIVINRPRRSIKCQKLMKNSWSINNKLPPKIYKRTVPK